MTATKTSNTPNKKQLPTLAAALVGLLVIGALIFAYNSLLPSSHNSLPSLQPRLVYNAFASPGQGIDFQADNSNPYITIYNGNLASVYQPFSTPLTSGDNSISYTHIPSQIIPASVFVSDSDPSTQISKQQYVFDTVSSDALLLRHLGQSVTLSIDTSNASQDVTGILRSFSGNIILQTADGIQSINPSKVISMKFADDAGLSTQPTLQWDISTSNAGNHTLNLSYLTDGLDWQTNYAITYDESHSSIDVKAWADVQNNTDFSFTNAKLSLVAGTVNRISSPVPPIYYNKLYATADAGVAAGAPSPAFQQSDVSEYHRYDLSFPTTLQSNSSQQLNLLEAQNIPVKRELVFDNYAGDAVKATLTFTNDKASGLGVPLPNGTARVYTQVKDRGQTFVGEDAVANTPQDKDVKLQIGEVFDVKGERKVTNTTYPSKACTTNEVEVKLTNAKTTNESVKVVEHAYGDTRISGNNFPFTAKDAQTFEFIIPVNSNATQTLKFTENSCYPQY